VDWSTHAYFPQVGDQGKTGSCVAWAVEYYALTFARNVIKNRYEQLSPRFAFSLLNGNNHKTGSNSLQHAKILKNHGCPTLTAWPWKYYASVVESHGDTVQVDTSGNEWPTNKTEWQGALSQRISSYTHKDRDTITANPSAIAYWIKSKVAAKSVIPIALPAPKVAGNVVDTYFNASWYTFYKRGWERATASNGDSAVTRPVYSDYLQEYKNGVIRDYVDPEGWKIPVGFWADHEMAIVGYDDTVTVDINKNGVIEAGEKGAWKVVNSWGNDWENDGFIWIPYAATTHFWEALALTYPNSDIAPGNQLHCQLSTDRRDDIWIKLSSGQDLTDAWYAGNRKFSGWLTFDVTGKGNALTVKIIDAWKTKPLNFINLQLKVGSTIFGWDKVTVLGNTYLPAQNASIPLFDYAVMKVQIDNVK